MDWRLKLDAIGEPVAAVGMDCLCAVFKSQTSRKKNVVDCSVCGEREPGNCTAGLDNSAVELDKQILRCRIGLFGINYVDNKYTYIFYWLHLFKWGIWILNLEVNTGSEPWKFHVSFLVLMTIAPYQIDASL